MKYCTKCKTLFNDKTEKCNVCGKKVISDPNHFSPVKIVTANGFELERIRAALEDSDIPYSYNESTRDTGIQILNSAPPENCDVFVPLSAYRKAEKILIGIGALSEESITEAEEDSFSKAEKEAEEEELPPEKAKTVRILSGIGFLIILALTVWLADFLFELIKNFFAA